MKRYQLAKADRIRRPADYRSLSKVGRRRHCEHFILVYRKTDCSTIRLGITVSKKVGKAVTRNKIKRIIRDYFRLNRDRLPERMDINVIARHTAGRLEAAEIRENLGRCFEKIAEKAD